ncbi:class I SAM-dependent methyltransferase [Jatrophihabitans lederbergiae]|uniref:Class I SAM-dependent methyltransferase n=1 Tax=Jatrophihabitans lederbergiae TaxID=3075547 RepID=A0ABU2J8E3_9ACTN|nr:class I SAM-dependent methyltransferase [Jatrophihabitans sp. DSM 44399]MDT0261258.1 class I SAM-dependent methyltransferase [Jatrophihabitans sp. DSM 44399]
MPAHRTPTEPTPAQQTSPAQTPAPRQRGSHSAADFDTAFAAADVIGGWLTRDQARALWDEARRLPAGSRIIEIGSHQGRSTVVLASAAPEATVVAIDPFVSGPMFGGLATKDTFLANLRRCGVTDRVELRQAKSTDLRPGWTEPIGFLYIDGKHDYWTLSDDLRWAEFLAPGARLSIHDAYSSIGVTLGLLRHVLPGSRLRYLDRTGSLARFEVGRPTRADRLRVLAELPWWLHNVGIKVLLRLKLYPIARLMGHTDTADPY